MKNNRLSKIFVIAILVSVGIVILVSNLFFNKNLDSVASSNNIEIVENKIEEDRQQLNQVEDDVEEENEVQQNAANENEEEHNNAQKNGSEMVDLKRPLIVLTFDDGFESDYTIAYPLFKERGIVGTSYINGSRVRTGKPNGRMSWEQIKELKDAGWDIQGHTFSHVRLTELTDEEVHQQFALNDEAFEQNGLPKPEHFSYPFGAQNENVKKVASEYRKSLRRTTPMGKFAYNTYEEVDFNNLGVQKADINDNNYVERIQQLKNDIDAAVANDGILILYSHEMMHEGAGDYETKVDYYFEVVDYAMEKGMEFVTISELYDIVSQYRE